MGGASMKAAEDLALDLAAVAGFCAVIIAALAKGCAA
jgi:hypothetical protein